MPEGLGFSEDESGYDSLTITDPTALEGKLVPLREWLVEGWLPKGVVTLLYGDGGVGKTLLAQQLMTACATGHHWIGLPVPQCPVFGIFCEDDEDEVHRRQNSINASFGLSFSDLTLMRWACSVGADNVLLRFDRDGSWAVTPRFVELSEIAKHHGAQLIVIDTAADTFGGNENDRAQVRAFLGSVLTKLARETGAAILINAHPSRTGMSKNGDLDGGSTAWSNTARSRWSIERPTGDDGAAMDETRRVLSRRKANYASRGEVIELKWSEGVLIAPHTCIPNPLAAVNQQMRAEATFLSLLASSVVQNRPVSSSRNAGNYAPKFFAKLPGREGFGKREFEAAMNSLFDAERIMNLPYGRRGDERSRIVPATADANERTHEEGVGPEVLSGTESESPAKTSPAEGQPSPAPQKNPGRDGARSSPNRRRIEAV